MPQPNLKPKLEVLAMPIKGCSYGQTWNAAFDLLCKQLDRHFKSQYEARFIELFTPESFQYTEVMQKYQNGEIKDPIVLLDGEIIHHTKKLSAAAIKKHLSNKLVETASG